MEAVYNEREIQQVILSCIYSLFFITRAKKKNTKNKKQKKPAFCFKGKVRKISQYIFLLHHNIKNYKKSNCNKRNWMLACTYSLKRQQATVLQEHNSTCLQLILLRFHLQLTPSWLVPALELIHIPHYLLLMFGLKQKVTLEADAFLHCLF